MTQLIINADDFGLNESCTRAIVRAFQEGYITDTTMVANGESFDMAVAASLNGKIGIHFNLTEGKPLTQEMAACADFCKDGFFHAKINRYRILSMTAKASVYKELTAQVKKIREAGISITHADSHHHIHTAPFIASIVFQVCKENDIPALRLSRNLGEITVTKLFAKKIFNRKVKSRFITTDYFGGMMDATLGIPGGSVEIMVHPDLYEKGMLIDRYGNEERVVPLAGIEHILQYGTQTSYKEITSQ